MSEWTNAQRRPLPAAVVSVPWSTHHEAAVFFARTRVENRVLLPSVLRSGLHDSRQGWRLKKLPSAAYLLSLPCVLLFLTFRFYFMLWCYEYDTDFSFLRNTEVTWAFFVAQTVKNLPTMWETWVRSLVWEDLLEKGKATHCSLLAWRIPWTEEPGGATVHGVTKSWTWLSDFHFLSPPSGERGPLAALFTHQV